METCSRASAAPFQISPSFISAFLLRTKVVASYYYLLVA
ncbi:hypothetical protein COLO4_07917 [Corchorus olitorius]|uniref:Uncharacterized protein n=1 Tax=Corchorus olitorius TaxID=93759 RepID=A0A1R3KI68_9ROSI|nr:hypothetical protein COLO4_07917 [Corchorus olitorius]